MLFELLSFLTIRRFLLSEEKYVKRFAAKFVQFLLQSNGKLDFLMNERILELMCAKRMCF
jgi:hypothetical protein